MRHKRFKNRQSKTSKTDNVHISDPLLSHVSLLLQFTIVISVRLSIYSSDLVVVANHYTWIWVIRYFLFVSRWWRKRNVNLEVAWRFAVVTLTRLDDIFRNVTARVWRHSNVAIRWRRCLASTLTISSRGCVSGCCWCCCCFLFDYLLLRHGSEADIWSEVTGSWGSEII